MRLEWRPAAPLVAAFLSWSSPGGHDGCTCRLDVDAGRPAPLEEVLRLARTAAAPPCSSGGARAGPGGRWLTCSRTTALRSSAAPVTSSVEEPRVQVDLPPLGEPGSYLSLWLLPGDEADYKRLQDLIDRQSARLGTPSFAPHATLLGGIEVAGGQGQLRDVLDACNKLAGELDPLELRCKDVAGFDQWNQCLMCTMELTKELEQANVKAQLHLTPPDFEASSRDAATDVRPAFAPPVGLPHLSVVYADFADSAARAAAMAELAENERWLSDFRFTAKSLSVWYTSGGLDGVPAWRMIADFPLGDS